MTEDAERLPSWLLTLEQLEATNWAREFREDSPVSYPEALRYAQTKNFKVYIERSTETGEPQWVAHATDDEGGANGFWMDAKATRKELVGLCREMGWRIASK